MPSFFRRLVQAERSSSNLGCIAPVSAYPQYYILNNNYSQFYYCKHYHVVDVTCPTMTHNFAQIHVTLVTIISWYCIVDIDRGSFWSSRLQPFSTVMMTRREMLAFSFGVLSTYGQFIREKWTDDSMTSTRNILTHDKTVPIETTTQQTVTQ